MLRRSGLYISRGERSICFCGRSIADFENATPLMKEVRRALRPNYLLLCSPDPVTCDWLRRRFTGSRIVPPPWESHTLVRRYFQHLDPVILFWIGLDQCVPLEMLRHARRLRVPVIAVDAQYTNPSPFLRKAAPLVDRFFVCNAAVAEQISALGGGEIVVTGPLAGELSEVNGRAKTLEELGPILKGLPQRQHNSPKKCRFSLDFSKGRLGTWIASKRAARRIESWDGLRERLGNPQSIFCLGNGPSSEDPAVLDVQYDCLMRVNHRWLGRGILTKPDMVFVGNLLTTLVVPPCVFGFRGIIREKEMLLRHLIWGRRFEQLEHFTLERVAGDAYSHKRWSANPTNGAVMIATAVQLRPGRIVIGGIDLFSDPRGRYPGETVAENEYMSGHAREVDLAVIDDALSQFNGRVEILSPGLESALLERRSRTAPDRGRSEAEFQC